MGGKILIIRHGEDPPDDRVYSYFSDNGFEPVVRRPFAGESLDDIGDDIVGSVIHGGPYNAYDVKEHAFLGAEYRWIGECLNRDIPLLGICQGAQQIAHHHGACVGPKANQVHEFGYYEVRASEEGADFLPMPQYFTQAHFHMFDIPSNGVRLAESDLFENQAFRIGRKVYGLQFHAEVTVEGFRRWQRDFTHFDAKIGVQSEAEQNQLQSHHDAQQADWFMRFMSDLFPSANNLVQTDKQDAA